MNSICLNNKSAFAWQVYGQIDDSSKYDLNLTRAICPVTDHSGLSIKITSHIVQNLIKQSLIFMLFSVRLTC